MIELPDFKKQFHYENNFYLSCDKSRMRKVMAHYELLKMAKDVKGEIVECGVFKGVSLARFAMMRDLLGMDKKIIGFDTFGKFPETGFNQDRKRRQDFVRRAGDSIGRNQLIQVLRKKQISNYELVQGDICETVPKYAMDNPNLKISLLNLDVDLYEPTVAILKYMYPLMPKGGILVIDDYDIFEGETKAVDDYFKIRKIVPSRFRFADNPHYMVKR